jgi:transcriptional regulator with XRE-family HTH domain
MRSTPIKTEPAQKSIPTTQFEAVRELRRRLRITQQEFAHQTELSTRTISVYELGKTSTSDGVLYRFAKLAFDHGYDDLARILTPGHSPTPPPDTNEITDLRRRMWAIQREIEKHQQQIKALMDELMRTNDRYTLLFLASVDRNLKTPEKDK